MATDALVERAEEARERAERLLERTVALVTRAEAFTSNPPPPNVQPSLAGFYNVLNQVKSTGIEAITDQLSDWKTELDAIAEGLTALMKRIEGLPQELAELSLDKVTELVSTINEQIRDTIEDVDKAFTETAEQIEEAIEATEKQLKDLNEKARATIETALTDVQDVLDGSRRDVDQIISTLENTRRTVLTICRSLGIGAAAAEPALDVATSAFSAVS